MGEVSGSGDDPRVQSGRRIGVLGRRGDQIEADGGQAESSKGVDRAQGVIDRAQAEPTYDHDVGRQARDPLWKPGSAGHGDVQAAGALDEYELRIEALAEALEVGLGLPQGGRIGGRVGRGREEEGRRVFGDAGGEGVRERAGADERRVCRGQPRCPNQPLAVGAGIVGGGSALDGLEGEGSDVMVAGPAEQRTGEGRLSDMGIGSDQEDGEGRGHGESEGAAGDSGSEIVSGEQLEQVVAEPIDVGGIVSGAEGHSETRGVFRDGRRADWLHMPTALEQGSREAQGGRIVSDDQGKDGGWGVGVEREVRGEPSDVVPEALAQHIALLPLHLLECVGNPGEQRGTHSRAEDEGAGAGANPMSDGAGTRDEGPSATESLGEGADEDGGAFGLGPLGRETVSASEETKGVGFVDVCQTAVGLVRSKGTEVEAVAVHGEDGLSDPPMGSWGDVRPRRWGLTMREDVHTGAGEAKAVDDARVIELVALDEVVGLDEGGKDPDVQLEA